MKMIVVFAVLGAIESVNLYLEGSKAREMFEKASPGELKIYIKKTFGKIVEATYEERTVNQNWTCSKRVTDESFFEGLAQGFGSEPLPRLFCKGVVYIE